MPVVMVSSLTQAGADTTLEALEIGAVDFVAKPADNSAMAAARRRAAAKIKAAARTRMGRRVATPQQRQAVRKSFGAARGSVDKLIAIGASTGGVEALNAVLMRCRRTARRS